MGILNDILTENSIGIFFFNFFSMFIFERQRLSREGAEREGDTESKAAVSTEPDVGLKPTNLEIMI